MISRSEAMDIPDIQVERDQQARIAALGITVGQFQKTLQGRAMIEREERFVINGMLYQGFNQKAIEVTEDLCTDEELAGAHDVDGTRQRILDTRRRRLEGAANAKNDELAQRRRGKIAQERDELELMLLRKRVAALDPDEPEPDRDPEPEPEVEPEVHAVHACGHCGKMFKNARGLNAHKMGSKHR